MKPRAAEDTITNKTDNTMNQLTLKHEMPITAPSQHQPTVADFLKLVIDKGLTTENVASFKELVQLHREELKINAEKEFATAFVALQADMPEIVAETVIPNRGKYARFEDVMHIVGPILQKHGFSVAFTNSFGEGRITETCHLMHIGGHSKTFPYSVRLGGRADSDTQADVKASTTAKRKALQNALNIVIRQDCLNEEDDARLEGGPITPEQAEELARRVAETNSDRAAFLKFAGATSFATIAASKYDVLDESLRRKERSGR